MLGVMGIIAALGAAFAFLPLGKLALFALYFGLFSAAAASLPRAYPKFAERKLRSMEARRRAAMRMALARKVAMLIRPRSPEFHRGFHTRTIKE